MSDRIEYDELVKLLKRIDGDTINGVLLTATKSAANALRDRTKEILLRKLPAAKNDNKYGKPMVKGVMAKTDKDYVLSYVTIMKEYKLKWFEMGTAPRFQKKRFSGTDSLGRRRRVLRKDNTQAPTGRIKPLNYFKEAREQYSDSILDDMQSAIIQSLERITGSLQ